MLRRHRWVRGLFRGDDGDRLRRSARSRSPPQQSGGELASALSATRASDAALSKLEDAAEVRLIHAQVHNQFNQERHLVTRQVYKQRPPAALAEWRAWHRSPVARGRLRCMSTSLRYFDTAHGEVSGGDPSRSARPGRGRLAGNAKRDGL